MSSYKSNTYTRGKLVRVVGSFFDESNAPADPTSVSLKIRRGDGAIETHTTSELSHAGAGVFTYDVDTTSGDGQWWYRWTGTGAVTDAAEGVFFVTSSL